MTYCAIKWRHHVRSSPNFGNLLFWSFSISSVKMKWFEAKLTILENGIKRDYNEKIEFLAHNFWCNDPIELKFSGMIENDHSELFVKSWVSICDIFWKIAKDRENCQIWSCDFMTSPYDVMTTDWRQMCTNCLTTHFVDTVQISGHLK